MKSPAGREPLLYFRDMTRSDGDLGERGNCFLRIYSWVIKMCVTSRNVVSIVKIFTPDKGCRVWLIGIRAKIYIFIRKNTQFSNNIFQKPQNMLSYRNVLIKKILYSITEHILITLQMVCLCGMVKSLTFIHPVHNNVLQHHVVQCMSWYVIL